MGSCGQRQSKRSWWKLMEIFCQAVPDVGVYCQVEYRWNIFLVHKKYIPPIL